MSEWEESKSHTLLKVNKRSIGVDTWGESESFKMEEIYEEINRRMKACDERELTLTQKE